MNGRSGAGLRPYLAAAVEAACWLRSVGMPSEHGLTWPIAADEIDSAAADLYYGGSGVVLFFLEMASASGDPSYLEDIRRGADHLLATLETERQESGLYTGIAGLGFVLAEVGKATGETKYRQGAEHCLDRLRKTAQQTGAGVEWGRGTDIIEGSAGTGLFLLYAAREVGEPEALALAAAAGRRLTELSQPAEGGITWARDAESRELLPGFSHGTAGVAYFLASLHLETGDPAFLDAALGGARHLIAIASTDDGGCLIPHHLPGGEELHYLGWCHGSAGTGRLFYRLYQATGESDWLEWLDRGALSIARSGIPERFTPGFWNNAGLCCGSAAVAEFLLRHQRLKGDGGHRTLLQRIARNILERATRTEHGLQWIHAEHRDEPDLLRAQTGLMQGAAGIGLLLLALDAADHGRNLTVALPDSPFSAGRDAGRYRR